MTDLRPADPDFADDRTHVKTLASQAIDRVMTPSRSQNGENDNVQPYASMVEDLAKAFLSDDPDAHRAAVSEILQSGISSSDFIQSHAGDTARLLGELWSQNEISFVETSIGSARMQETVRALASRRGTEICDHAAADILLLAPAKEDHLLGLFVARQAFEDLGCYVHVAIGHSPEELCELVQNRRFAMIGISISSLRTVKDARVIVQKLRATRAVSAPIVLGGSLVADATKHADVLAEIGVDHVICDPQAALKHCGIAIPTQKRSVQG